MFILDPDLDSTAVTLAFLILWLTLFSPPHSTNPYLRSQLVSVPHKLFWLREILYYRLKSPYFFFRTCNRFFFFFLLVESNTVNQQEPNIRLQQLITLYSLFFMYYSPNFFPKDFKWNIRLHKINRISFLKNIITTSLSISANLIIPQYYLLPRPWSIFFHCSQTFYCSWFVPIKVQIRSTYCI